MKALEASWFVRASRVAHWAMVSGLVVDWLEMSAMALMTSLGPAA